MEQIFDDTKINFRGGPAERTELINHHRNSYVYALSCAIGSSLIFLLMIILKYFYHKDPVPSSPNT